MKNESVLVTGGAGFIGSHLVDGLIAQGYKVRVLDNLSRPTHNGKLPSWFNKKAEFIKGDVRKKQDWIVALGGVRYVFHLAAYMDYHPDFHTYIDTNIASTALLFEIVVSQKLPVQKIVIASSQAVYGEGKYQCARHGTFYADMRSIQELKNHQWEVRCPRDTLIAKILPEEETDELHPQIPYGITKAASETLSLTLGKTYNIPTVALRYSIVQGARQSFRHFYSGALRDFCVQAIAGGAIATHEDGGQLRDFINVHDVVDAHLLVLRNAKADYQVFNVGMGRPIRVMDLARTVANITGTGCEPESTGEFRINCPRSNVMNISTLKKLGFTPKCTLADSVREYVDWVRHYPQAIMYWKKTYQRMRKEGTLKQ